MLSNDTTIGCSLSSTSFADIIINNVNAVAQGLISGFAQFVFDPKYLSDMVGIFNNQKIPDKFSDAVMLRRMETQKLDDTWNFPLNMTCANTVPLPWTIIDSEIRTQTSTFSYEYNIMRITNFIGRNYVRIVLPQVDTTEIQDQVVMQDTSKWMTDRDHMYLGSWHRDLIPRIVKKVSFYPRANAHKLFEYTGYDIFIQNILFGNAAKAMNDLMAGEDDFKLVYDPYRVHGSALGLASYKGIDNVADFQTNYAPGQNSEWISVSGSGSGLAGQDGFIDSWKLDTYMDGDEFRNIYRKNVWYEAPVAQNYAARHSIHSRRFVHAKKVITFPLDILPFGYSIASSLPTASLAGDCGYLRIELYDNWFDRSFYLTKASDIPLLHPIVNHTHVVPGDAQQNLSRSAEGSSRVVASLSVADGKVSVTGRDAFKVGWVNPTSIGRYGDETYYTKLSGLTADHGTEPASEDLEFKQMTAPQVVGGEDQTKLEGLVMSRVTPEDSDGAVWTRGGMNAQAKPAGVTSFDSNGSTRFGQVKKDFNSKVSRQKNSYDFSSNYNTSLLDSESNAFIYNPSSVSSTWAMGLTSKISLKLLQIGYQTLPCINEFLVKLPNVYITTEWNTKEISINDVNFDIMNDIYAQAILFWFIPQDENGIESMRLYPHHLINHEAPVIPGLQIQNEQAQGQTVYSWDLMNLTTPHILGMTQPLLENMGLISFTPKLVSNEFPSAYYDPNICGYLKCQFLKSEETNAQNICNLVKGVCRIVTIGTNGVALCNLNLYRLIF